MRGPNRDNRNALYLPRTGVTIVAMTVEALLRAEQQHRERQHRETLVPACFIKRLHALPVEYRTELLELL